MDAMQDLYLQKLARWQNFMEVFSLPGWEELPDMDLYVDQVVTLVSRYLNLIPQDEKNPLITASSINNYVRLRVMPAPVRKRYGRRHLAYVLMICTLKQSMALTEIQKILPPDLDDEDTKQIYANFVGRINGAIQGFIDQVNAEAARELVEGNEQGCTNLVLHSAVNSVLYKLLTVKLTNLTYYWTSVVASPITIHYMFGASLENFNLVDSSVNSKTIVYSQYATIHIDSVVTGKWLLIAIRTDQTSSGIISGFVEMEPYLVNPGTPMISDLNAYQTDFRCHIFLYTTTYTPITVSASVDASDVSL